MQPSEERVCPVLPARLDAARNGLWRPGPRAAKDRVLVLPPVSESEDPRTEKGNLGLVSAR